MWQVLYLGDSRVQGAIGRSSYRPAEKGFSVRLVASEAPDSVLPGHRVFWNPYHHTSQLHLRLDKTDTDVSCEPQYQASVCHLSVNVRGVCCTLHQNFEIATMDHVDAS